MTTRFELVDEGFADPCLTTWPRHHIWSEYFHSIWSGRRGSNSLPPPWQGGALPDELRPHIGAFTLAPQGKTTRIGLEPTTPSVTGWCSNQLSYRAILEQRLLLHYGAADEARTRYLHLGKVALYQMSYGRIFGAFVSAPSRAILANIGAPAKACEARFCGEEEEFQSLLRRSYL